MVARVLFPPLFFSFHHQLCQHLFMRDIWQRAQIPEEFNHFVSFHDVLVDQVKRMMIKEGTLTMTN